MNMLPKGLETGIRHAFKVKWLGHSDLQAPIRTSRSQSLAEKKMHLKLRQKFTATGAFSKRYVDRPVKAKEPSPTERVLE